MLRRLASRVLTTPRCGAIPKSNGYAGFCTLKEETSSEKNEVVAENVVVSENNDVVSENAVVSANETFKNTMALFESEPNTVRDFSDKEKYPLDLKLMEYVELYEELHDFIPFYDEQWRKEIHPLVDGSKIKMEMTMVPDFVNLDFKVVDRFPCDVKVKFVVPLSALKLHDEGRELAKQILGPRVQGDKFIMTTEKYRSRVENHKLLCNQLRDVLLAVEELLAKQKV